jgi:hypothetical protein
MRLIARHTIMTGVLKRGGGEERVTYPPGTTFDTNEDEGHYLLGAKAAVLVELSESELDEKTQPRRFVSVAELRKFTLKEADGVKKEKEVRSLAEAEFSITDKMWRDVWSEIPATHKRRRGETDRTRRKLGR